MNHLQLPQIIAGTAGIAVSLIVGYTLIGTTEHNSHTHDERHEIGTSVGDEVHVHADFMMYINNERIRFTDSKYQSDGADVKHASMHFHDGKDEVIHRHADGITLVTFLDSIGFTLTDTCLTTDTNTTYCNQDENEVRLVVNGERVADIGNYIIAEEDKVLVYYGDITNPAFQEYVGAVSDNACIYSGTCPERGVPPPENCGLTCEVFENQ